MKILVFMFLLLPLVSFAMDENVCGTVQNCQQMASQGNANAQFLLGKMYYQGSGVEQNNNKAFELFMQAAKQGHVTAEAYVGRCFYYGAGVQRDYDQALQWAKKAASKKD